MPRQRGGGRVRRGNQGEKRKSRNSSSRSVPCVDFVLSDSDEFVPECLITPEQAQQPRRSSRKRSHRNQSRQNQEVHVDLTQLDDEAPQTVSEAPSLDSSGANGRRPRRRGAQRAAVISLDVTYSSDELNGGLSSPEITPKRVTGFVLSPSPKKGKSSASDDSESDTCIGNEEAKSPDREEEETGKYENFSDSDVEDLFSIDYTAERERALKSAIKEYRTLEKEEAKQAKIFGTSIGTADVTELSKEGGSSLLSDSLDLDISLNLSDIKLPVPKKKRKGKNLRKVHRQIKSFEEEISKNLVDDVFTQEVVIDSDEEDEDPNPSITLLIRWDSTLLRWPVRQYQKFSTVYKEVAERFSLDVGQVLLCFNDKVISPDACPKDLKLSIGDILEGGVQSQPTVVEKGPTPAQRGHSPDSIPLKIQNADKKGSVTIYMKRTDKMIELMHRYAEEKNVKLETLRFKFDGETLDPSDTPESLDLEGDECIDVYSR